MVEGMFSCFKRLTTNMYQPLHHLPQFVFEAVRDRRLTFLRRMASASAKQAMSTRLNLLEPSGCLPLVNKAKDYLTAEGYKLLIDQLQEGMSGYEVRPEPLTLSEAKNLLKGTIIHRQRRAASATQFLCLLELEEDNNDMKLFQVTARSGGLDAKDIVLISRNGSFACTDPFFAQMGMPCRKILAVHIARYCQVNVLLHYHPLYHDSAKTASLTVVDKLSLTARTVGSRENYVLPAVTESASWSWAQDRVLKRWTEVGLGGAAMAASIRRPYQDILASPTTEASNKRKEHFQQGGRAKKVSKKKPAGESTESSVVTAKSALKPLRKSTSPPAAHVITATYGTHNVQMTAGRKARKTSRKRSPLERKPRKRNKL
jgi:hypothetical protein